MLPYRYEFRAPGNKKGHNNTNALIMHEEDQVMA